jgi:hypothetical protein
MPRPVDVSLSPIAAPLVVERRRVGGRHRDLEPVRLLKAMSIARSEAGCGAHAVEIGDTVRSGRSQAEP